MKSTQSLIALAALSLSTSVTMAAEKMPTQEEMWAIIQKQQKQINKLTARVKSTQAVTGKAIAGAKADASKAKAVANSTKKQLAQTQAQLEATTLTVEEAVSSGPGGWWENTSIGGYGELHANFVENADNEIDFHRFVLFIEHEFNDWITLYSELELEHSIAGEGKNGEIELEQAFVRMDWTKQFSTDAGLFILPVGITNETHEPNTFYGVERNRIENRIIPTTWWEGGLAANYNFANGLALKGAITSGLDIPDAGSNAFRIRSGRQKVGQAINNEAAFVGRAKYTGIPGLEVAGSVYYQDDMSQSGTTDFSGLLTTAHAVYRKGGFGLKALYARWDFDGNGVPTDAEEQFGYYIEPSYRWEIDEKYGDLGVYVRYSDFEYYRGTGLRENEVIEFGVNYWPTDNVVFKLDYQDYDNGNNDNGDDSDSAFNLGVGYQF